MPCCTKVPQFLNHVWAKPCYRSAVLYVVTCIYGHLSYLQLLTIISNAGVFIHIWAFLFIRANVNKGIYREVPCHTVSTLSYFNRHCRFPFPSGCITENVYTCRFINVIHASAPSLLAISILKICKW